MWLDDETSQAAAAAHQAARSEEDPWEDRILSWVGPRVFVTVPEVLGECLGLTNDKQSKATQMRVADVLRRAGWSRRVVREGREVRRRWYTTDPSETDTSSA